MQITSGFTLDNFNWKIPQKIPEESKVIAFACLITVPNLKIACKLLNIGFYNQTKLPKYLLLMDNGTLKWLGHGDFVSLYGNPSAGVPLSADVNSDSEQEMISSTQNPALFGDYTPQQVAKLPRIPFAAEGYVWKFAIMKGSNNPIFICHSALAETFFVIAKACEVTVKDIKDDCVIVFGGGGDNVKLSTRNFDVLNGFCEIKSSSSGKTYNQYIPLAMS